MTSGVYFSGRFSWILFAALHVKRHCEFVFCGSQRQFNSTITFTTVNVLYCTVAVISGITDGVLRNQFVSFLPGSLVAVRISTVLLRVVLCC